MTRLRVVVVVDGCVAEVPIPANHAIGNVSPAEGVKNFPLWKGGRIWLVRWDWKSRHHGAQMSYRYVPTCQSTRVRRDNCYEYISTAWGKSHKSLPRQLRNLTYQESTPGFKNPS